MDILKTAWLPLSNLDHVGVVVRDLDRAIEYYESLGIGPFWSMKLTAVEKKMYGKPADNLRNKSRKAQLGPIQIELVQPVEGESLAKMFLDSNGEGINHLCFRSDDIERDTSMMVEQGFKVTYSGKIAGGGGFAFFDSDKLGGVIVELAQYPPVQPPPVK